MGNRPDIPDVAPSLTPRVVRLVFLGFVLFVAVAFVATNAAALGLTGGDGERLATDRSAADPEPGDAMAEPRDNVTVVTSEISGYLLALDPDGSVRYYDESHYFYYDVDESPAGSDTVVYSALDVIDDEDCDPYERKSDTFRTGCTRQVIERANLTTGETTELYSRVYPKRTGSEWHDVDRVNESEFLVADMYSDEVYIVDTETGTKRWGWEAQDLHDISVGGVYPDDWTHLNDVELLDDGRIMVSLRNQDQVVFLDPSEGVLEEWTLGEYNELDTLFAQHNPDYIPEEDGGPAVVVSDSENNRIIEYERDESGEWNQSWVWGDRHSALLEWPRDGDRLPNGHTLITDTHNDRLVEVDTDGEVVWSVDVSAPYEAERLGTGDESEGGPSASAAGLQSETGAGDLDPDAEGAEDDWITRTVRDLLSAKIYHGTFYTLSLLGLNWIGIVDLLLVITMLLTVVLWGLVELYWSAFTLRSPITRAGD